MKKISYTLIVFLTTMFSVSLNAQNVGINSDGSAPDSKAMLDVKATGTGFLLPRMTWVNRPISLSSTQDGLIIYSSDGDGTNGAGFYYYKNPNWLPFMDNKKAWSLLGNAGITPPASPATYGTSTFATTENFLGTTDAQPLIFGTNNRERMRVLSSGLIGIGTAAPTMLVDIIGGTITNNDAILRVSGTGTTGSINSIYGTNASTSGVGIYGKTTAASGSNNGVIGEITAGTGNGVKGIAGSAAGNTSSGVWGVNNSTTTGAVETFGVLGTSKGAGATSATHYGLFGDAAGGSNNYGVYGKATGTGTVNYGGYFTASGATTNYGIFTPNNAAVRGYLEVGNPSVPSSNTQNTSTTLYTFSGLSGMAWSIDGCNTNRWFTAVNNGKGYILYDNIGSRSRSNLYAPYVWVPTDINNLVVGGNFDCTLEDNYDGLWIEYSIDGGANWIKITSFNFGGYPDNADGSNTACTSSDAQSCWNGALPDYEFRSNTISGVAGKWLRLRIVGSEDGANATGDFRLYGLYIECNSPTTVGGSFASGNIYAEKNVYAGSNVLLGDLAEYFKVESNVEAGDLVSINHNSNDSYKKSKGKGDKNVVGVVSTNPTLTINNPNSGVPIALTGRVPIKVNNENGKINIGDYLMASSTSGEACKATSGNYVVGKALEGFNNESGKILCLVENGWFNNNNDNTFEIISEGLFPKGISEYNVFNTNVNEKSKIFLTMNGPVGSQYWISKKEKGLFEIKFEKPLDSELPFDYVIYNLNDKNSPNSQSTDVVEHTDKITIRNTSINTNKSEITTFNLNNAIPPTPAEQEKSFIFENGVIKPNPFFKKSE